MSLIGIADACGQIQDQILQQGSGSTALFTKTKKGKQAEQADKGIYVLKHGKKIKKIFVITRLETEFKWFAASMFSMVQLVYN